MLRKLSRDTDSTRKKIDASWFWDVWILIFTRRCHVQYKRCYWSILFSFTTILFSSGFFWINFNFGASIMWISVKMKWSTKMDASEMVRPFPFITYSVYFTLDLHFRYQFESFLNFLCNQLFACVNIYCLHRDRKTHTENQMTPFRHHIN